VRQLAENLWLIQIPLRLLGTQIGRNVTVIRLPAGQLIVHSTAPFPPALAQQIHALGTPGWLVEATLFHDTSTAVGRAAFPGWPLLAPHGFPAIAGETSPLSAPPPEWEGFIEVLPLAGMPRVNEHLLFHRPSRTLILADLMFNLGPLSPPWTRCFFRWMAGIRQYPGMSRFFRLCIRDRHAFATSITQMMAWDFDRVIFGHGTPIESGAKPILASALARHPCS
jgi:hypothetical protein